MTNSVIARQPTLDEASARTYPFVAIAAEDGGWHITFPDLPGCMTDADTWEEIGASAREAFELWMEYEVASGRPIPEPTVGRPVGYPAWRRPLKLEEPSGSQNEPRYTSRQVADRLGVSPRRVQALARTRGVGQRMGRAILFSDRDLAALADRHPGRPRQQVAATT